MTTWSEACRHVAEGHEVAAHGPGWLGLVWSFARAAGGARVRQRQRVELVGVAGRPHVVVTCDVSPCERLPADEALALNLELGVGALARIGDTVVLRAARPLAGLDLDELDWTLEVVAHEAARLREGVVGRAAACDVAAALGHWL
jgi:hypothetical protein